MVTLAIDALLVIFALGCLMARFPTMHTQSSALTSSRAMAVLLAVEAMQRVRDVWLHRDPQVTSCDVFRRLWRCKRQYYSISTTSASLTCIIEAAVTPWGWSSSTISSTLQSAMLGSD